MYHSLSDADKRDVLLFAANKKNVDPIIIEKDFWVVKTLGVLFSSSYADVLTFKGGTSLSKCFNIIERFSEDIDVTIQKEFLSDTVDWQEFYDLSRKKRSGILHSLNDQACFFIKNKIIEDLKNRLDEKTRVQISTEDPLSVEIFYPSVLSDTYSYITPKIYIEFGFRGSHSPSDICFVSSYLRQELGEEFSEKPVPIRTLSPLRTLYEKATLLHAEYHRPAEKNLPLRLSRHYYDLSQMYQKNIFDLDNPCIDILKDVIRHKQVFFSSSWTHYETILQEGIRMLPQESSIKDIKNDYEQTKVMIFKNAPHFSDVLEHISQLEIEINKIVYKESILS